MIRKAYVPLCMACLNKQQYLPVLKDGKWTKQPVKCKVCKKGATK